MLSKANSIDEGYWSEIELETQYDELLNGLTESFRLLNLGPYDLNCATKNLAAPSAFVPADHNRVFKTTPVSIHAILPAKESALTILAESYDPRMMTNLLLVNTKNNDLGITQNMNTCSYYRSHSKPSDISVWYTNWYKKRLQKTPNQKLSLPSSCSKIGSCSNIVYQHHGPCETFEEFVHKLNENFDYFKLGNFASNLSTASSTVNAKIRRYPGFYGRIENQICQVGSRAIKRSCTDIQPPVAASKRSRSSCQKVIHFKTCQKKKLKHKEVNIQYRALRNQQYWALIYISSILPSEPMEIELSEANEETVESNYYDIPSASETENTVCTSNTDLSDFGCWCGATNLESCLCTEIADAFLSAQEIM